MSYEAIRVVKFKGLNSTVAPELIADEEARDILNFRMEKVGKLVSRDGYIFGLFTDPTVTQNAVEGENNDAANDEEDFAYKQYQALEESHGIIGIGEYILSDTWDEFDTDRFMVYMVRAGNDESISLDDSKYNHRAAFLFAPMTGQYKNKLIMQDNPTANFGAGIDVHDKQTASPQTPYPHTVQLYAANRDLIINSSTDPSNATTKWIEHYADFSQYRHKLIISDRINGDMLLENDYDTRDLADSEKEHRLYLRPNALERFDINIVGIDLRLGTGQENDATEDSAGVESGMALYNYQLPEDQMAVSEDGLDDGFVYATEDFEQETTSATISVRNEDADNFINDVMTKFKEGRSRALFNFLHITRGTQLHNYSPFIDFDDYTVTGTNNDGQYYQYAALSDGTYNKYKHEAYLNYRDKYVFTNALSPEIYKDVLGKLELLENNYETDEGTIKIVRSSDVFIWENLKFNYFPCEGTHEKENEYSSENLRYLLTAIDRQFSQADAGPKLKELKIRTDVGQEVPLGIWRYKFVWEFEDGSYSAPSAEMLAPDMMWSVIPERKTGLTDAEYERPVLLEGEEFFKSLTAINANYTSAPGTEQLTLPYLANSSNTIDNPANRLILAEHVFKIKNALYDVSHNYGPQHIDFDDLKTGSTQDIEDFSTMVTVLAPKNMVTQGYIGETVGVIPNPGNDYSWDAGSVLYTPLGAGYKYARTFNLIVPMFQSTERYTWNSVFDDRGKLRLPYQYDFDNLTKFGILYFPGFNTGIGDSINVYETLIFDTTLPAIVFGLQTYTIGIPKGVYPSSESIYLGVDTILYDNNNDSALLDNHPSSILRGVLYDQDRLSSIAPSRAVPSEAIDRLILSGYVKIPILENGTKNYFVSELGTESVDDDYWNFSDFLQERDDDWSDAYTTAIGGSSSNGTKGSLKTLRSDTGLAGSHEVTREWKYLDNLDVIAYLPGERLIAIEQLTSYFPSSLLWKAPRIGLKIEDENIPARATKLHIYRTKASHANDFDPNIYGLVDSLDIERDSSGNVKTDNLIDDLGTNSPYFGIYYFDQVPDNSLNFTDTPEPKEGLRDALHSRFNIPLNERIYYLNFKQTYQPEPPRKLNRSTDYYEIDHDGLYMIDNVGYYVLDSESYDQGYDTNTTIWYKWIYEDYEGNYSPAGASNAVTITVSATPTERKSVALIFMPSIYEQYIKKLHVYRAEGLTEPADSEFLFLTSVDPMDEGVVIDDGSIVNSSAANMPDLSVKEQTYESGMMWSEAYTPDFIKFENFAEYRSGDGDQITGVTSLYGNLLIFKETSMHRVAVQADNPPLSRTDEISPDIGCIAPNTLINIDNVAYFLSWKGLMSYDNNKLQKIDALFDEELQHILRTIEPDKLRDAACGYNPHYNELYLNLPYVNDEVNTAHDYKDSNYYIKSDEDTDDPTYFERRQYGHIYVLNLDKGYATKFGYQVTVPDLSINSDPQILLREVYDASQMVRKYYTNSLGEMRSADILPLRYFVELGKPAQSDGGAPHKRWAGFYIESPYKIDGKLDYFIDYDELLDNSYQVYDFPQAKNSAVVSVFKSKFFTGDHESMIKRLRKVVANIFSKGYITLRGVTIPKDLGDDRIENGLNNSPTYQEFNYNPTIDSVPNPLFPSNEVSGTNRSVISFIPKAFVNASSGVIPKDDTLAKPIRFSIEVEASRRTQISQIELYWRPIYQYLA